jgi:acyl carrier protein
MNELTTILTEIRPGENFAGVDNFFDRGVLDSLDLTALVASLESRYGIFLDIDEIVPENFKNLDAIRTLLGSKGIEVAS